MFVFRNYTIESLFDESVKFSGYGDISVLPDSDCYAWFYNAPIVFDAKRAVDEIAGIGDKLFMICEMIPSSKPFYIFSLENLFPLHICETDNRVAEAIAAINKKAIELSVQHHNVRLIDFGEFLSHHKPQDWMNWKFYFISQMVINPILVSDFKEWWGKKLASFTQVRKKCLVLDLDNTLWDGVLGEDGISGIKMSGDYPGNAFMYFQEGVMALANSGIIITVCSKNNEADVKELWERNPFIKIGPQQIAAYRINWNSKADNIRELAKELNIGLDSMVFVDDNPTERELVRQQLPMVSVPEFPQRPYELMNFYFKLVDEYFQTYRLTSEDQNKTEQYKANARRVLEQARFTDLTDFIKSLDIRIDIIAANEFNVPRIAQMTQKTNQFNLTTYRYTEADINTFIENGDYVYCISVRDKFGDNGITGAIIIKRDGNTADIDSLLLSCRILGKDIETAFVKTILNKLFSEGVTEIKATYIPTLKNGQVVEFYEKIGFQLQSEENGIKIYQLSMNKQFEVSELYTITIN
ncbi:HAD-IIIC family phosphatase [Odoribacter lunatus]|uniref:HAD-IIIC family phosphatase n=1 Tax=Odoribacter lunatus TaxID=2941335 RepID=UPI0020417519|nr:HAD-IIIC family phosphatase [Odoribacter lunatus]